MDAPASRVLRAEDEEVLGVAADVGSRHTSGRAIVLQGYLFAKPSRGFDLA
jgi:hypothetical protein